MASRLIIVANRLPVSVHQTEAGLAYQPSPGGMAAALSPILGDPQARWVGYTGVGRRLSLDELEQLALPKQLVPVNVGQELYRRYYYNFSNGSLWPALHGFTPKRLFDELDWEAALAVTIAFAERLSAMVKPDDVIWVHDFHLIMLPKLLRDYGVTNRIGYFLHVPFADEECFKALPHHEEMLGSLGAADLCGFQTEWDVERFEQYVRGMGAWDQFGARLGAFPVGIGYDAYEQAHDRPEIAQRVKDLKAQTAGKRVIFSISRLDYTKGILEQLAAVEMAMLATADRKSLVYKLVVAPSREDLAEYSELKDQIAAKVQSINDRLEMPGWRPVDYEYRNFAFDEVVSWYCLADVMLVAPLIDGMNLIAKEYVATKVSDDGVLILSKSAGAAMQLKEALLVDPTKPSEIAVALEQALAMPRFERRKRQQMMRNNARAEDAAAWAQGFIDALMALPRSS